MELINSTIPVRSEQQAMDWSLVLASQGIETHIEGATEEHGWQLVISSSDFQRAIQALRLYRQENKNRSWQQPVPGMGLIFDWRSVFWFGLLAIIFVMEQNRFSYLRPAGVMDTKAVLAGEWWRLCTAVMLHKDFSHLISNVTFGIVLLGLTMGTFGAGPALLAAFLAGVGGNIAGLVIYSEIHRSLGASGMVMGALGLLTAHSLWHCRSTVTTRQLAGRGLLGGILLLVLLGLNPDSDVIAHVGGFVAGVVLGSVLSWLPPELLQKPLINRLSELFCCGLVVLTWWLALV